VKHSCNSRLETTLYACVDSGFPLWPAQNVLLSGQLKWGFGGL